MPNVNGVYFSLVNTDELMPITAPLKPLEHCAGPFLEKCDENDDGRITLEEWGTCLGLDPGQKPFHTLHSNKSMTIAKII